MKTIRRAVLEELIYECVRQYSKLWETTQYTQALVEQIELTKSQCAESTEEQRRLVNKYTDRAWRRLLREGKPARA